MDRSLIIREEQDILNHIGTEDEQTEGQNDEIKNVRTRIHFKILFYGSER